MHIRKLALLLCLLSYPFAQSQTQSSASHDSSVLSGHGTVVVGVALSEGLVLAADSRATLPTPNIQPGYMILSDNGTKVFEVGKFGVATFGTAFLQKRTIASWVAEYKLDPKDDVDTFATHFAEYFSVLCKKDIPDANTSVLGFYLAGYDSSGKGKLLVLQLPAPGKPSEFKNSRDNQGPTWSGHMEVISRLVKGHSEQFDSLPILSTLSDEQRKQLMTQRDTLEYYIPWDALMLQDGVDFATAMVKTTVIMQRFAYGTVGHPGEIPAVGGAVDVLVVTPSGVHWVQRKALTAN